MFEIPEDKQEEQVVEGQEAPKEVVDPNKVEEPKEEVKEGEGNEEEQVKYIVDEVNAKLDFDLSVEYGEVDPDSPEGLHLRDQAIIETTQERVLGALKEQFPNAYRLYLHELGGGTIDTFDRTEALPEVSTVKGNLDLQRSLYTKSLKERGIEDEDVSALVEKAIKDNSIESKSIKYVEEAGKKLEESTKSLEEQVRLQQEREDNDYAIMNNVLDNLFFKDTNTFDLVKLNNSQKPEAFNKFTEALRYENGQWLYIKPVTNDNIKDLVQSDVVFNNAEKIRQHSKKQFVDSKVTTLRDKNRQPEQPKMVEGNPNTSFKNDLEKRLNR